MRDVIVSAIVLMCVALPATVVADTIKIGGTGSSMQLMRALGDAFHKSRPDVEVAIVSGLGSRGGKKALLSGVIDIAISADPPTPAEHEQGAAAIEWARTPFVFAASANNPLSGLTPQELVDIYRGKTTAWRNGERLRLVLRPSGDSDNTALRNMSPAMREALNEALSRQGMMVAVTDEDAVDAIQSTPGALGTTTLGLIISGRRPVKALSVNGVAPSPKAIADGSYPYFKTIYIITGARPSQAARRFIDFARSASGREILARMGFSAMDAKGP